MARHIDAEQFERFLHRDDHGTPDERWRPESEWAAIIDAIPTADVVPVVHAHWIDYGYVLCCSSCLKGVIRQLHNPVHSYCEYCGARMDELDITHDKGDKNHDADRTST